MSYCICPRLPKEQYDQLVKLFVNDKEWDLLKLQKMYLAGNSLESIMEVVPFRNDECTRTKRCCGVCTRRCHSRCIQDCHIGTKYIYIFNHAKFESITSISNCLSSDS